MQCTVLMEKVLKRLGERLNLQLSSQIQATAPKISGMLPPGFQYIAPGLLESGLALTRWNRTRSTKAGSV